MNAYLHIIGKHLNGLCEVCRISVVHVLFECVPYVNEKKELNGKCEKICVTTFSTATHSSTLLGENIWNIKICSGIFKDKGFMNLSFVFFTIISRFKSHIDGGNEPNGIQSAIIKCNKK